MFVVSLYGPQMGRTEAEKQQFRDRLVRMMGMVQLEAMLCIAGRTSMFNLLTPSLM